MNPMYRNILRMAALAVGLGVVHGVVRAEATPYIKAQYYGGPPSDERWERRREEREQWRALPPEQRQQIRSQMREHWQQMPPEQREQIRQEHRERWQQMPPEERQRMRQDMRDFRGGRGEERGGR